MTNTVDTLEQHAARVMLALGRGHSERTYHKAMITSLNRRGILHRSEVIAPIYFMGEVVGFGRCDLIIDNLIVEFKANVRCPTAASPQLQKYIQSQRAAERKHFRGVIINFNQRTGGIDVLQERAPAKEPAKAKRGAPAPRQRGSPPPLAELETLRYPKRRRA
jgi:GxxExxY protein